MIQATQINPIACRPPMVAGMATVMRINRVPVLTLWSAVVAERLGFDWEEALTLGQAVAGLNAHAKGVRLGLFEPTPEAEKERRKAAQQGKTLHIALLGRAVPAVQTPDGVRALKNEKSTNPESVARYLQKAFGDRLDEARAAMEGLARSLAPADLAKYAYHLYEQFRPSVPPDVRGWGAKGDLDLAAIAGLARTV
jgi:hypothetical protein